MSHQKCTAIIRLGWVRDIRGVIENISILLNTMEHLQQYHEDH